MARPNYEEQFKRKLQDRELQPSSGSWEKLSGRMELEGKKESPSPFKWWMGIAAAFVAGLLVMNFFFSSQPVQDSPALVDENQEVKGEGIKEGLKKGLSPEAGADSQYASREEENKIKEPAAGVSGTERNALEGKEEEGFHNSGKVQYASAAESRKGPEGHPGASETGNRGAEGSGTASSIAEGSSSESQSSVVRAKLNPAGSPGLESAVTEGAGKEVQRNAAEESLAAAGTGKKVQERTAEEPPAGEREIIGNLEIDEDVLTEKLEEVVAEASSREAAAGEVSDAEIDALLMAASAEIKQDRGRMAGKLGADELLYEVEMELEESFRARVFELLKEGFKKTRTAVANRNN